MLSVLMVNKYDFLFLFIDFIVPLTGFMCTVCHETLADETEAMEHQNTNSHKEKVVSHKTLFEL